MAICSHCGGEMTEGISCLTDPVIIDGRAYAPIPWGQELRPRHRYEPEECRDCGTPLGRGAPSGLLHGAVPGLPRPGHRVRLPVRARLHFESAGRTRAAHHTCCAASAGAESVIGTRRPAGAPENRLPGAEAGPQGHKHAETLPFRPPSAAAMHSPVAM